MTEAHWRTYQYPWEMYRAVAGRLSDRQVRLWACACARLLADHFDHRLCGPTVELAERLADGLVSPVYQNRAWLAIKAAAHAVRRADPDTCWSQSHRYLVRAVARDVIHADINRTIQAACGDIRTGAYEAALAAAGGRASQAAHVAARAASDRADATMCDLLRDVAGGPTGSPPFHPAWRATDAVGVARGIYEDRAFHRMPILGDALLDAGCDDDDILDHCGSRGRHVKGCWVVDLVLAKE